MITDEGRLHLRQYLAGIDPQFASHISYGIGTTAPTTDDHKLEFEVERQSITLKSIDYANSRLILRAPISNEFSGAITEIGLFSSSSSTVGPRSRILTTIDENEFWSTNGGAPVFVPNPDGEIYSRIGLTSLQHNPSSGNNSYSELSTSLDLSGYLPSDLLVFAFHVGNNNTSDIEIKLMTDDGNYYMYALGAQTAGYKVVSLQKGDSILEGSPNWSNISKIGINTLSAGGSSDVRYDGIRIEPNSPTNRISTLIAREVLGDPFIRQNGRVQEVEFYLNLV